MLQPKFLSEGFQRLKTIIDVFKGREDAKIRPNMILNPENPLTTSNLSDDELSYINSAYFMAKYFPEANSMLVLADIELLSNLSKDGFAIQKIIDYEQAISEKRLMQLGLKSQEPSKEKPKTNATKE